MEAMTTAFVRPSRIRLLQPMRHAAFALGAVLSILSSPPQALAAPAKPAPAKTGKVLAECSWDRPGHDKYSGDVPTAIDRYPDIPADVRARLRQRMLARDYDDMVSIRRDSIAGKRDYGSEIRDMHFGAGNVCRTVTRAGWSAQMHERGMVYCDSGHCILVPTVCRNVSRIVRRDGTGPVATTPRSAGAGEGESPAEAPGAALVAAPDGNAVPSGGDGGSGDAVGGGGLNGAGSTFAGQSGSPLTASPWAGPWASASGATIGMAHNGRAGPYFETSDGYAQRTFGSEPALPAAPPLRPELDAALPGAIPAVPEPQTWALLAGGLALLGAVKRRRRRGERLPTAQ